MDDSNMSMFDLSINDLWESSYHIFFYTYVVIWILVAYRTHAKSNQAGKLFSGLGTVIFFGFIGFFMLLQVLEWLKDEFYVENVPLSVFD